MKLLIPTVILAIAAIWIALTRDTGESYRVSELFVAAVLSGLVLIEVLVWLSRNHGRILLITISSAIFCVGIVRIAISSKIGATDMLNVALVIGMSMCLLVLLIVGTTRAVRRNQPKHSTLDSGSGSSAVPWSPIPFEAKSKRQRFWDFIVVSAKQQLNNNQFVRDVRKFWAITDPNPDQR